MNFYKKILVLKQIQEGFSVGEKEVSGVMRLEFEDGTTSVSFSLINFRAYNEGSYYLAVYFENNSLECFEIGKKPTSIIKTFSSHKPFNGFSAGIFAVDNRNCSLEERKPTLVCFAKEQCGIDQSALYQAFLIKLAEFSLGNARYDDEAVATENYYSLDEGIKEKIDLINGWDNELNRNEAFNEHNGGKEEEKERGGQCNCLQDEKDAFQSQPYSREYPYYLSAKAELEELFDKFPKDLSLSSIFPASRFCKIHYSKDKFYTVGEVEEKGEVKYICYGVPGRYAPEPPKELKEYCSFVPLSIFDLQGEGFWMMFQDAITGECVKKEESAKKKQSLL